MERDDFDDLVNQAQRVAKVFGQVFKDVTGEDLDVEGAVRHSPFIAVGVGVGIGMLGGWLLGRKSVTPAPPVQRSALEHVANLWGVITGGTGAESHSPALPPEKNDPFSRLFPGLTGEEAAGFAKTWFTDFVEPRVRQQVEQLAMNAVQGRLVDFFRQRQQGPDTVLDDDTTENARYPES